MNTTANVLSFKLRLDSTQSDSRWIMFPSARDRLAASFGKDPELLKRLVRRMENTACLTPLTGGDYTPTSTQNPVVEFCLRLLGITSQTDRVTLATFAALPEQSQLLMAHCLERRNSNLTLIQDDPDFQPLVALNWLVAMPCTTVGVVCFKIAKPIWARLQSLQPLLLNDELLSELPCYRMGKSALYPWIW